MAGFTRQHLHDARLIKEKKEQCICQQCGFSRASKITEVWEGLVLVGSGPEQRGGYFGERPEEYGEGYVEWQTITIEEGPVIKCPNCSAHRIGEEKLKKH